MSSHRRRQSRGRGVDATGRTIKRDRFLQLPHFLLTSEAWKSLSPIERTLFIEVAQRYNGHNNGEIGLGVRAAGEALHVRPQTVGNAFHVLIEAGFLKVGRDSAFNVKSRLAREWIVTLFPHGDRLASRDFMHWRPPTAESRKQMRTKPLPVANEDTVSNKRTSDGDVVGHCEGQTSSVFGGLKRITSISHQGESGSTPLTNGVAPVLNSSSVAPASMSASAVDRDKPS
jgi:hypothetical protein